MSASLFRAREIGETLSSGWDDTLGDVVDVSRDTVDIKRRISLLGMSGTGH